MTTDPTTTEPTAATHETYRVTIRREHFFGRDSFVARDDAGVWRSSGNAVNTPMTPQQLAEYLFHKEEIAAVGVDPMEREVFADIFVFPLRPKAPPLWRWFELSKPLVVGSDQSAEFRVDGTVVVIGEGGDIIDSATLQGSSDVKPVPVAFSMGKIDGTATIKGIGFQDRIDPRVRFEPPPIVRERRDVRRQSGD